MDSSLKVWGMRERKILWLSPSEASWMDWSMSLSACSSLLSFSSWLVALLFAVVVSSTLTEESSSDDEDDEDDEEEEESEFAFAAILVDLNILLVINEYGADYEYCLCR